MGEPFIINHYYASYLNFSGTVLHAQQASGYTQDLQDYLSQGIYTFINSQI